MSYSSHTLAMNRLVRDIHAVNGLISDIAQGADRPVYPHRDKRKRPVIWLENASFAWLQGQDMIMEDGRGFVLVPSLVRRLETVGGDVIGQHEDRVSRDVYTPDGVVRPANVNMRSSALELLARRKGHEKGRWLSAAELEAGRALARDYHRSGEGAIKGQDFTNSGVSGGDRNGAEERAMLARITASTRLRTAREILGADFAPGVIALCCRNERIEMIERTEKWASGSGKQLVKMGLARLVKLYGTQVGVHPTK